MDALRSYLQSFGLLTSEDIALMEGMLVPKSLKQGEYFIREGATCRQTAFIAQGAFRSYYHSSDQEEVTYCFTFANSFLTAYSSLLTQAPTEENIQALTDAELWVMTKEQMDELEATNIRWLRLFKLLAEGEYVQMERRVFMLQRESAETRYQDLLANHPQLLQEIPLSYLASYLGITPRHLSRIRKALAN